MEPKESLKNFIVGELPTVMYIPDFITESEQTQLLNNIYGAPATKWKALKNRRLQNWGGIVHEKGLLPQALPPWLAKITQRIYEESGLFPSAINHVLINEYLPNQGIMPHQDGPAYFPVVAILSLGSPAVMDFTPHPNLQYPSKDTIKNQTSDDCEGKVCPISVLLKPLSLLIFKDDAYTDYLHGIKDTEIQQCNGIINKTEDLLLSTLEENVRSEEPMIVHRTSTRVSLTCRLVLKVHKNLFKF